MGYQKKRKTRNKKHKKQKKFSRRAGVLNRASLRLLTPLDTAHQEHGEIDISNSDWFDNLPIGSLVRVLPNHSCLTCAGHSSYNILENNMIIDNWRRTNGW